MRTPKPRPAVVATITLKIIMEIRALLRTLSTKGLPSFTMMSKIDVIKNSETVKKANIMPMNNV